MQAINAQVLVLRLTMHIHTVDARLGFALVKCSLT